MLRGPVSRPRTEGRGARTLMLCRPDVNSATASETVWWFLKKLNAHPLYDSAIPLLGIYSREMETNSHTKTCTLTSTAASVTKASSWDQPEFLSARE